MNKEMVDERGDRDIHECCVCCHVMGMCAVKFV